MTRSIFTTHFRACLFVPAVFVSLIRFPEWGIVRAISYDAAAITRPSRPGKYLRNFTFYLNFISEFLSGLDISSSWSDDTEGRSFYLESCVFTNILEILS